MSLQDGWENASTPACLSNPRILGHACYRMIADGLLPDLGAAFRLSPAEGVDAESVQ